MASSRLFFLSFLFLFQACNGSGNSSSQENLCVTSSKIIIGSNDWIDHGQTGDDPQNANERTVALVKIPALMANCTGFLINEDTLMTNNHCIGSVGQAVNVKAVFRDDNDVKTTYACDQFITTNSQYDFTLVKCSGVPGQKFGWVGLSEQKAVASERIYVVQENCDYIQDPRCVINKYVAFGEVLASQAARLFHDADTLGGSSGSPVFSEETHQVVALHHAGGSNRNEGIPMYQIKELIAATTKVQTYEIGTSGGYSAGAVDCDSRTMASKTE